MGLGPYFACRDLLESGLEVWISHGGSINRSTNRSRGSSIEAVEQ